MPALRVGRNNGDAVLPDEVLEEDTVEGDTGFEVQAQNENLPVPEVTEFDLAQLRAELLSIRKLLDT